MPKINNIEKKSLNNDTCIYRKLLYLPVHEFPSTVLDKPGGQ